MTLRDQIVTEALSWERTPYKSNARIKGVGVDCAQILAAVFEAVGAIPHVDPEYPADWHLHRDEERYLDWVLRFASEIAVEQLMPGDVMLWKYGRTYSHGAIYLGDGWVVHAFRKDGAVTRARPDETEFTRRPMRCFRVDGID